MRVFVTGATGYIGSAVARELADAGHDVAGLTRMAEKSSYLEGLGARAVLGDIRDVDSYRGEAAAADALVHIAAEDSPAGPDVDLMALEALLRAAEDGKATRLVYTSGCFVLGETEEPAAEDASTDNAPPLVAWRPPRERRVIEAASPALATAVIRPGMVYGGKNGMFATYFVTAERNDAASFIGDGANHWSPVYLGDVARLYRLVLEERARGIFHCAEGAELVGNLAVAASRAAGAGGATHRIRLEEAREEYGPFADALVMDQVMICPRSRELGWEPEHPPFVESADAVYAEWKG